MDTLFEREFAKRLAELMANKTINITHNVLKHEEYLIQIGYFQCIRDIQEMCQEIRGDINKG